MTLLSKETLDVHIKIHSFDTVPKFPCKMKGCENKYRNKQDFWYHMREKHNVKKEDYAANPIKCDKCEKIFRGPRNLDKLKRHMIRHSDFLEFVCSHCPKQFKAKISLINHTKRHQEIYDYPCDQCDKKFVTIGILGTHKTQAHSTEELYSCDHCGNSYKTKGNLVRHATIHTGGKFLKCRKGCENTFRLHDTRTNQERTHNEEKEFGCKFCSKMFRQEISLSIHIKRHKGIKNHICVTCGRKFVEPAGARYC